MSGFGQTDPVRKKPSAQESTGPLPPHFQVRFRSSTNDPDNTVQNQPGSDLVLADCVRFWPNGSGPETSRCARIIRTAFGQCFPADPDRMPTGSGMFTGNPYNYSKPPDSSHQTVSSRALSVFGPSTWNDLPLPLWTHSNET